MLGKTVRLNRIFHQPDGRIVSIAVDHGISLSYDLPAGLRRLRQALAAIMEGKPDALTMTKGTAKHCFSPYAGRVPLIVQTMFRVPHLGQREYQMGFVEEALRLGADAISMSITVGDDNQGHLVQALAQLVREADPVGLPVIAHLYPSADRLGSEVTSLKWVRYAARTGMEVGVDVMKLLYTGDPGSFSEIVEMSPIPIVCAGGPRTATFREFLTMVQGVIQAGGRGMTAGRNVWEEPDVPCALRALHAVVHEHCTADEALARATR
ncbi:MAG: aldolase [Planctomycetes bacterium]|nr:aldolase [Planctomycetota bacterium]